MKKTYEISESENTERIAKLGSVVEMKTFKTNVKPDLSGDNCHDTIVSKNNKPEVIPNQTEEPRKMFKIVCVGGYGGIWSKGVFIRDYVNTGPLNVRDTDYKIVLGVDFYLKNIHRRCETTRNERDIWIQIWEIAEQERFCTMTRIYYKNASGAIVFWRAQEECKSFETALKWKENIQNTDCNIPIVLLVNNTSRNGTPVQWIGEGRMMESKKAMDEFCIQHGFLAWYEILSRQVGEESVFGKAISRIINESQVALGSQVFDHANDK